MPTTSSLLERQSGRIQEKISTSMTSFMAKRCMFARDRMISSAGVVPADQLGRDWKIIEIYQNPVGGVVESDRGRGNVTVDGDTTTLASHKFYTQQLSQSFPDPLDGPVSLSYKMALTIKGFLANLFLTLDELAMDANPNVIDQIIAPRMRAFSNLLAQHNDLYFWLNQNQDYRLAAVSSISAITSTTSGGQTFYTFEFQPDNLATSRFMVGDRVDMYSTGGDRKNDSQSAAANQTVDTRVSLWVAAVKHMSNKVVLASTSDPANWSGAGGTDPANGDYIMYANSKLGTATQVGLNGLESYLKFGTGGNDNYILGAERDSTHYIDVTKHPEFTSYLKAVNGPLTESKLQRYLAMALNALDVWDMDLDTIVCSFGIEQRYLEEKVGQYQIDRTGKTTSLSNEGNTGKLSIVVNGKKLTFETARCIAAQTVYGLKMKGNWKMIVPPSGKGMTKSGDGGAGVPFEFVAKALGMPGNLVPMFNAASTNAKLLRAAMMPGQMRLQWMPKQIPGLKLTGVTEAREYSDGD